MRVLQRAAVVGGSAIALASMLAAVSGAPVAAAPQAASPPCTPQVAGPTLPPVPVYEPAKHNGRLEMHVRQTDLGGGATAYCYQLPGQTTYVDAPTIQVRQGEKFEMVLVNELKTPAPASGSAMPMPMPAPTAPDGCAQMPSAPTPSPAAAGATPFANTYGVLGLGPTPDPRWIGDTPTHNAGDTNFHTHGWHVSPLVDNVFKSLDATVTPPGGTPRTCSYPWAVPTDQPVGTYWYHSHMHGVAGAQVGGGLAGAIIVLPLATAKAPHEPQDRVILIKNYVVPGKTPQQLPDQLGARARNDASVTAVRPRGLPPGAVLSGNAFSYKDTGDCGFGAVPPPGLQGPALMVNGYKVPQPGENWPTPVAYLGAGVTERERIVNASSNYYVDVQMTKRGSAAPEPLVIVSRDGVPISPNDSTTISLRPNAHTHVILPPGGRVDIDIVGSTGPQMLSSRLVCGGPKGPLMPARQLVTFTTPPVVPGAKRMPGQNVALAPHVSAAAPGGTRAAQFLRRYGQHIDVRRTLAFSQYDGFTTSAGFYVTETVDSTKPGMGFVERPFWLAPGPSTTDPDRYLAPNITVNQDDTEEWTLVNASPEIHAFHIHQMTFVATLSPYETTDVKLDTLALPPARVLTNSQPYPTLTPSVSKILINFSVVDAGTFVYHCHMLFHEDHGMMGIVTVLPSKKHPRPNAYH
jgi:FtsP/CotA-like multicopper oxidase with cupredoxin domain